MTKNVTLRLDQQLLRRARMIAVQRNASFSMWVTGLIEEAASPARTRQYTRAREKALALLDQAQPLGIAPVTRESLHARG